MAGAGFKNFAAGQVLTAQEVDEYLMQQSVMRFANAAARTTALSGVLAEGMISYLDDTNAVEKYDGSAWVSVAGTASPLTTKGDLYTYTTTNARLGVGNNGETLIADSSASTGLRWQSAFNGNAVINSGMDIWQRGTSFTSFGSTSVFTADRYYNYRNALASGMTVSRQNTNDTTNLPFIQYCMRIARDSGNTGTTALVLLSDFETSTSLRFAGQTVTFSYYARCGANYSAASNALSVQLVTGTGTDQALRSGYTNQTNIINANSTLTTTWQRFTHTATIGATVTQIGFSVFWTPTGTAGANDWVEITGFQLELGSCATAWKRSGGTLAGELAACQRYYYRLFPNVTGFPFMGFGQAISSTVAQVQIKSPVSMRIAPTAIEITSTASNYGITNSAGTALSCSSLPTFFSASTEFVLANFTVSSGLTAGNACQLLSNNTTATYVGISAEL